MKHKAWFSTAIRMYAGPSGTGNPFVRLPVVLKHVVRTSALLSSTESTYDDDRALTAYIWRNYLRLFTSDESLGYAALIGTSKAENASPTMQRWLRERWGHVDDPEVAPMFADGIDVFRDRVRDRILRECPDDVFVNRCSACTKIVVTPKAKQCLWCGHDWH